MPRQPTWEDWLRDPRICGRSMRYFQRSRVSLIKTLSRRIAEENVLGHLKKAYHNLDLTNRIFGMHEGELEFRYEGENFFDWVVTICYYAMYQASLAALAAVRKEGEIHSATVCALIYHYVHKKKRLGERHLISLDLILLMASARVSRYMRLTTQKN